jgi:uncharacterized protein (DUF302 family)
VAVPYYFAKTLSVPFSDAVQRVTQALQKEGFGIITEIDVQETFRKKLGAEFRDYRILGACNPKLAFDAIQLEDKIGTMLPCNVVVQAKDGVTEVAAIDPVASMTSIDNPRLKQQAQRIGEMLKCAVESL